MYYYLFCRPGESAEHSETVLNETKDGLAQGNNDGESTQDKTEKRLRNLRKKLQQIEKLKSKQDEGEEMEDLQVEYPLCVLPIS